MLAPLARAEAERLLPRFTSARLSLEDRVLRARCLRAMETFEPAWNELTALRGKLKDQLLEARIEQELMHLAYYMDVPVSRRDYEQALRHAAGDALLVAEIALAWSVHRLVADNATESLSAARRALDALQAVGASREKDLVTTRVQRQLAHVLAQSGEYRQARAAAEAALATARRMRDAWEVAWCTYASGFATWCAGAVDGAEHLLADAEELLRPFGTSAWRWTVFCLGRVRIEQGHIEEGDRLTRQSAAGSPSERAYVALARREANVAWQLLEGAPPRDHLYNDAVRAMIHVRKGEPRPAVRLLEDARTAFDASGLVHYALGCAAHLAFTRENLTYGAGRERGVRVVRELADRAAEGFAWFLPEVAEWLGKVAASDVKAAESARVLRARGETARRRGSTALPAGESEVDGATAHLRMAGLTWRELEIVRRLAQLQKEGEALDRGTFAERLGMSPNTLRVHLTRIRSKLDVGEKRGDEAILEAVRRLPGLLVAR